MRFLVKFLLLVSVRKDIDFFSMHDEGFLLIRTNSLEGALAYLKGGAPIDAILIEAGADTQLAFDRCAMIKRLKPACKIVLLTDPEASLPESLCADVVLDRSISDSRLADSLVEILIEPQAREAWACAGRPGSATHDSPTLGLVNERNSVLRLQRTEVLSEFEKTHDINSTCREIKGGRVAEKWGRARYVAP